MTTNQVPSPSIPTPILQFIRDRFGSIHQQTCLPSRNNQVLLLDTADGAYVLKIEGRHEGAAVREAKALAQLRDMGLSVPAVVATHQNVDGPCDPFALMTQVPGTTLLKLIGTGEESEACSSAGMELAKLAAIKADLVGPFEPSDHISGKTYHHKWCFDWLTHSGREHRVLSEQWATIESAVETAPRLFHLP